MAGFRIRSTSKAPAGVVGKVFSSLFFFVFLGMGLAFVWLIARDTLTRIGPWTWQKTSCEVIASTVRDKEEAGSSVGKFEFEVAYRYRVAGQAFTAHQYKLKPKPFSDYSKAARLVERYKPGMNTSCYVNPARPSEAVLVRDNLFLMATVLFPMIFVVIGGGGIYLTWRHKPLGQEGAGSISDRAKSGKSVWALSAFFLVFLLAGSGFFHGFFLRPVFRIFEARNWPAIPCVVISSEVERHEGDDGDTFSVNILYRYELNGREHKANRYNFMGASSSGYSGKQAIVRRHSPGTETVCYVNPSDPTDAVLERGFTPGMWFGLLPLLFVAVGAGGLFFTIRKHRQGVLAGGSKSSLARNSSFGSGALPESGPAETKVLKAKHAPSTKLFGVIVAALFWNGIVSVFVMEAIKSWRAGRPDWFLMIFMVPFVLIGLGIIVGIFYFLLALFNPRPRLRVTPGAVRLGGTLRIEWEIASRTDALRSLRLRLEGREEAKYRRGTNTTTDKSAFADIEIAHVTSVHEMREGSVTVRVPSNLMHSFSSDNNQILWVISLHGEIATWPDVKEEFPVIVLPAKRMEGGTW